MYKKKQRETTREYFRRKREMDKIRKQIMSLFKLGMLVFLAYIIYVIYIISFN